MTDTVHTTLRESLVGERARVLDQLRELGHDAARESFDENFADSGQVTAERGEVETLTGTLLETLSDIDHALAKFDGDTYGACESCQQPIPPARLEAMPAARLCIGCASKRR